MSDPEIDSPVAAVGASAGLGRVGLATSGLTLAVAAGQLIAIGREVFVASQAGTSSRLDALLVALVAPLTLAGLLQSGTSAALVAAVGAVERDDSRQAALRLTGVVLTWTALVGLALTGVVVLLAGPFVALAGPGLAADAAEVARSLIPLVAPIVVLMALGTVVSALCQVADRFRPIALASIVNPLVSAIVTIALWPALDVAALALGMTAGAAATLVTVAFGAARAGTLPRPTLRARREHVDDFVRHAAPLWASSASLTLNLVADRAVASLLRAGSVSALRYGETVMRLPVNSIGSAWGTVSYPALVRSVQEPAPAFGITAATFLRTVVAASMPVTVGVMALAPSLVSVAFFRGAFDRDATWTTSLVVAALGPLFVLTMFHAVLVGALNARRRGMVLLAAGLLYAGLNLALNILLAIPLGVAGVALSTSITMLVASVVLTAVLARREEGFEVRPIASVTLRAGVASLVPAIPVGLVAWTFGISGDLLRDGAILVGGAIAGLAGFLVMARVLGIAEITTIVGAIRRRLRRAPMVGA